LFFFSDFHSGLFCSECETDDAEYSLYSNYKRRQNEHKKHKLNFMKYRCFNLCSTVYKSHKQRWHHLKSCHASIWVPPTKFADDEQIIAVENKVVKVLRKEG